MGTRRDFIRRAGTTLGYPWLAGAGQGAAPGPGGTPGPRADADVGSLFPFIQGQAVQSGLPLSFLGDQFKDLRACYEKAGVPEKVRTHLYDAPHEFNAAMQAEAWTGSGSGRRDRTTAGDRRGRR